MYFAHEVATNNTFWGKLDSALQRPLVAFVVVTLLAIGLMLGKYWFLKRYTHWQFPVNNNPSTTVRAKKDK